MSDEERDQYDPRWHSDGDGEALGVTTDPPIPQFVYEDRRLIDDLFARFEAMVQGQDEMSESVADLMAAPVPTTESPALERIAAALERLNRNVEALMATTDEGDSLAIYAPWLRHESVPVRGVTDRRP